MSRKGRILAVAAVLCLVGGGCGQAALQETEKPRLDVSMEDIQEEGDDAPDFAYTDALGREVCLNSQELSQIRQGEYKAAVLSGSLAEIWTLAGGKLSVVTEDAFEEESRIIDITEDTISAGSLKNPSTEVLAEAELDLAILSADLEGQVALAEILDKLEIPAIYISVEAFGDYLDALAVLTEITGCEERYEQYGTDAESMVSEQIARKDDSQPAVLMLRAYSSGVKAKGSDNMTGFMLKELGCVNVADGEQALAEEVSMEAIITADPDYIFVTTMGNDEEAALKSIQELLADHPAWKNLTAIKENHYYVLPQNLFHNKPNHRWAESYEILADILYPESKDED